MRKKWKWVIYGSILVLFGLFMWVLVHHESSQPFFQQVSKNCKDPFAILISQFIVIVSVTTIFGMLCQKIGQPSVIGQIVAGIVLGPSVIGFYYPQFSTFLFAPESLKSLKLFSDLGLILFMFIVGMELDPQSLRHKAHRAVVISNAGIIIPFSLGVMLSFFLYDSYAPASVTFISFALFVGIAMSITAFPVLARIIQERGSERTYVGKMALVCAAVDDVSAWCLLTLVVAVATAGGDVSIALFTLVLAILYILFMVKIIRPLFYERFEQYLPDEKLHKAVVTIIFVVLLLSAWVSQTVGIHAVFGAFLAGVCMPHDRVFKKNFIEKIQDISLVLLLPTFFAFSGLRTHLGLISSWDDWLLCVVVILVAIAGKFGGCFTASKLVGETTKNSLAIGALMNTRGLMELVVLNIGYDLGVLTGKLFTILVLMALVTTFLTGPSLSLINKLFKLKR